MAADKKSIDHIRTRPTSAPKSTQKTMTSSTVPAIVLDDRKEAEQNPPSSPIPCPTQHSTVPPPSSSTSSPTPSPSSSTTNIPSSPRVPSPYSTHKHNSTTIPSSPRNNGRAAALSDTGGDRNETPTPTISIHPSKPQISIRSSSDISIPAASMPNLTMHMGVWDIGTAENHLGVYCSPRTTRRSVDLDMKETVPGQYDWIESVNSLKVLTSSSRVGSALSLNSECTTRSIGLLSNDSDSEEFSQSERPPEVGKSSGQGQLRRYMSYPEEGQIPESSARPSQSLSNLKSANHSPSLSQDRYLQRQSLDYTEVAENKSILHDDTVSDHHTNTKINKDSTRRAPDNDSNSASKDSLLESVETEVSGGGDTKIDTNNSKDRGCNVVASDTATAATAATVAAAAAATVTPPNNTAVSSRRVIGSVRTANNTNMLCYKCDTNSPSRDGRIRQWLQDMDVTQTDLVD